MNQRHLIAAAGSHMAVERVVTGVDDAADEPAAIGSHGRIEDLFGRLDPVDFARRLGPEPLRIAERAGMDLAVAALHFAELQVILKTVRALWVQNISCICIHILTRR